MNNKLHTLSSIDCSMSSTWQVAYRPAKAENNGFIGPSGDCV